jgi:membrane protein implicated in regulation of membrane protease activity
MKNWKTWFTLLLALLLIVALFIVGPFVWDDFFNTNHYPIDWQAWWSFGTFIVAIAAALIAYIEYSNHKKDAEREAKQRENDYIRQVRPYVVLRITFERQVVFLEMKNVGRTPAQNINIDIENSPELFKMYSGYGANALKHALLKPFSFLAPNQRLIFFICTSQEAAAKYHQCGDELSFSASASYTNMDQIPFSETVNLDFGDFLDSIVDEDIGARIAKPLGKIAKTLADSARSHTREINQLNESLEKIANQTTRNSRILKISRRRKRSAKPQIILHQDSRG